MNLHNEIMNIPVPNDVDYSSPASKVIAYKFGHRDARHAAAELSLKAEVRIEELEQKLKEAKELANYWYDKYVSGSQYDGVIEPY